MWCSGSWPSVRCQWLLCEQHNCLIMHGSCHQWCCSNTRQLLVTGVLLHDITHRHYLGGKIGRKRIRISLLVWSTRPCSKAVASDKSVEWAFNKIWKNYVPSVNIVTIPFYRAGCPTRTRRHHWRCYRDQILQSRSTFRHVWTFSDASYANLSLCCSRYHTVNFSNRITDCIKSSAVIILEYADEFACSRQADRVGDVLTCVCMTCCSLADEMATETQWWVTWRRQIKLNVHMVTFDDKGWMRGGHQDASVWTLTPYNYVDNRLRACGRRERQYH